MGIMTAIIGGGIASAALTVLAWTPLKDTELFENLIMPWLGFIPIKTKDIQVSRRADVAKSVVIANTSNNKDYVTDNVVPHPRTWNINGYITSLLELDNLLYIKPTLVLQRHILDHYASDRKTHLFKTPEGEFIDVLISQLTIKQEATYNNAYEVSMELTEFNALVGKMTVLEDAVALANDAMTASLQLWIPILGGALMATAMLKSAIRPAILNYLTTGGRVTTSGGSFTNRPGQQGVTNDNNAAPSTPELSDDEKNMRALEQFVASGDTSGFTAPEQANEWIAQYFAAQAQGAVSVVHMAAIDVPIDTTNPIVSQAVRTAGGSYVNLLFVWDTIAQQAYNTALVARNTFRSKWPLWGKTFDEVAANIRIEQPNLNFIEYLRDIAAATSSEATTPFTDWVTLLEAVQAVRFKVDKFDFSALLLAAGNQDITATNAAINALLFPRMNQYFVRLTGMVNDLDTIEANILETEGNLKWIITFTSDIPGTQARTKNLEINSDMFSNDDYYSVRIISSKDQIGLQDLGLCSIYLETFI